MDNDNSTRFRQALCELVTAVAAGQSITDKAESFRNAALLYGSFSDENQEAIKRIQVIESRIVPEVGARVGLGTPATHILLTDVFWALEALPMPVAIKQQFPSLSEQDWKAMLRIVLLILTSFEQGLSSESASG